MNSKELPANTDNETNEEREIESLFELAKK